MAIVTIDRYTPRNNLYYSVIRDDVGRGVFIAYTDTLIIKCKDKIIKASKKIPIPIDDTIKVFKYNHYEYHRLLMNYNKQRLHVGASLQLDTDNLYNFNELLLSSLDCIDTI